MSPKRDRQVGAGYDYQWDFALWIALVYAVLNRKSGLALDDDLEWLGRPTAVRFEGDEPSNRLEDVTLLNSNRERKLTFQCKERSADEKWTTVTAKVQSFLDRVPSPPPVGTRYRLVSNVGCHKRFRTALAKKSVVLRTFLQPTALDGRSRPIQGIGHAVYGVLHESGTPDATSAYSRLKSQVQQWSFATGGTEVEFGSLRDACYDACIVDYRAGGDRSVRLMSGILPEQRHQEHAVSWDDVEAGRLAKDDPAYEQALSLFREYAVVVLKGPSGSGKSVMARRLAHTVALEGALPTVWDVEHMGPMHGGATEYVRASVAKAAFHLSSPCVVVENTHLLAAGPASVAHAAKGWEPSVPVIMTTRAEVSLESLPSVDMASGLPGRAAAVREWYLRGVRGLSEAECSHALQVVPWSDFHSDLLVLRLVLDAYRVESASLPAWVVDDAVRSRLEEFIAENPSSGNFLMMVAALGRHGIAADVAAAAVVLRWSECEAWRIANECQRGGLLTLNRSEGTCRFTHETLARLVWVALRDGPRHWTRFVRSVAGTDQDV